MVKTLDKDAIRNKYAAERAKRLRPDGNKQYQRLRDVQEIHDHYMAVQAREPRRDHVTVALIGGGFAGLITGARLKEAGVNDVRVIDKAGDFGGTWYWNRYPGAQCDTASFVYLPLLEETGHMPSEKYVHGPEILEHCRRIAIQYGLYDNALLHTEVTALVWNEALSRWTIRTNRGDEFTAQFVTIGAGPLHVAKLPAIPGIDSFKGHAFHTSLWDYAYTGGDPSGARLDKLEDKRVAIIGTGATSVQCVPHLADACKELYVFQRTPSSVDVRNNQPTDERWFKEMSTPGWQSRWLDSFASQLSPGMAHEADLIMDGWTDLAHRIRKVLENFKPEEFTLENIQKTIGNADFEKMEEIRSRVDSVVNDPATAASLKAWYYQLCKRPCFHDTYLQSYNQPNTHLIDTDGKGVERISENGVIVNGREFPVDCIIFATGFELDLAQDKTRWGYDPVGRDGVTLSTYWSNGMRSLHGIHVHNFPNMFLLQPRQGAFFIANIPHNLNAAGLVIAKVVKHTLAMGAKEVELSKDSEEEWLSILASGFGSVVGNNKECTPGYYNNEGQPIDSRFKLNAVGYPAGAFEFFRFLTDWRKSQKFAGLEFQPAKAPEKL